MKWLVAARTTRLRAFWLPAAMLLFGLTLTGGVSLSLWNKDTTAWDARAKAEAERMTRILGEWIEGGHASLASLASLLERSGTLDEASFRAALPNIEARSASRFQLESGVMGWQDGAWSPMLVSDPDPTARLQQTADAITRTRFVRALDTARTNPNQWVMSEPVNLRNGTRGVYFCLALPTRPDAVVSGVMDTQTLITQMLRVYAPAGIELEVEAETPDRQYFDYLYSSQPTQAAQYAHDTQFGIRFMNLRMHWIATADFQGGRRSTAAITMLWSGIALSCLISYLLLRQSLAQQEVTRQVERATRALQAREAQTRSMLESTEEGIFGIDPVGRILFANHAAARLLGHENSAELLGLDAFQSLGHARQDGRAFGPQESPILAVIRDNRSVASDDERFGRRGAGSFAASYVASPVLRDGRAEGAVVVFSDATAKKQAQALIDDARARAEDATRSKSDFLANMSHEIRTPMNSIIGMSHMALRQDLSDKARNYIDKVHRSANNLLGIVNDILDFSKIEAGKLSMEAIDFDLADVFDNLASLLGLKADEKGLELIFEIAPDVPVELVGDPLRLAQILVNLGTNAIKFTDSGHVLIGVRVAGRSDDATSLHFWVRDTGIGLTPEQSAKLFVPFSQADNSVTRKHGGTGLGLVICKRLVALMAGEIWVEDLPGPGASFAFQVRFGTPARAARLARVDAQALDGVRALVVDDNATARDVVTAMATRFGLACEQADSGERAVDQVVAADRAGRPFALVLLDSWMPGGMDGAECAWRIQDATLASRPALVLLTAFGHDDLARADTGRGARFAAKVPKPLTPSSLRDGIAQALGRGLAVHAVERRGRAQAVTANLSGVRVLLVEDNDLNLELALELLDDAGAEVSVAKDGREALELLARAGPFDGVLMDCQMPVMDGYTATRTLRANPAWARLPVIAMTANAMTGDRQKALDAGMNDHIAKPLNIAEMFATITRWIKPPALRAPSGLDTAVGLAHTAQKADLYRRLLRRFATSAQEFPAAFAAAGLSADPTAAGRCVHTFKGQAATLGAPGLEAIAAELEASLALADGPARRQALLGLLDAELAVVLPAIARFVDAAPVGAASVSPVSE